MYYEDLYIFYIYKIFYFLNFYFKASFAHAPFAPKTKEICLEKKFFLERNV